MSFLLTHPALAQLFFGRSVTDLSPLQVAQLAAAINTLTGGGGPGIFGKARQALGVDTGGKVAFDLRGGEVVVTRADAEHEDPAIGAFLSLLARGIEAGRNVQGLPEDLARAMLEHAGHDVNLGEEIDGAVEL